MQFDLSSEPRRTQKRPQVAIRVDYCPAISDVPIRRCLAIAEQLREQRARVLFVTADDGVTPYIRGTGFGCHLLDSDWRDPEPEVDVLIDYLEEEEIDILLLDQPRTTPRYLMHLREAGIRLAMLDDVPRFPYDVALLINPLPEDRRADYMAFYSEASEPTETAAEEPEGDEEEESIPDVPDPAQIRFLLGPAYQPLSAEFSRSRVLEWRRESAPLPNIEIPVQPELASESKLKDIQTNAPLRQAGLEPIRELFLTLAGADPGGMVERIVTGILRDPELKDVHIHLYCGLFFRVTEKLQIFLEDGRVFLHHEGEESPARLMCQCEAGVAPGGHVLYEFCACRLPGVSFYMSDAQRGDAAFFAAQGLIPCAGDYRDDWKDCIAEIIRELHTINRLGADGRVALGERAAELIDGQGAGRIAEALLALQGENINE
ncbi:MAG: hypothetical protein IJT34_11140 [Butyrivibrio sp.]|nr:hypothetical protein [Butyrivibrio sp.]